MKINPILLFQTADVTLMALPLWNVMLSLEIAHAIKDSSAKNVNLLNLQVGSILKL